MQRESSFPRGGPGEGEGERMHAIVHADGATNQKPNQQLVAGLGSHSIHEARTMMTNRT